MEHACVGTAGSQLSGILNKNRKKITQKPAHSYSGEALGKLI